MSSVRSSFVLLSGLSLASAATVWNDHGAAAGDPICAKKDVETAFYIEHTVDFAAGASIVAVAPDTNCSGAAAPTGWLGSTMQEIAHSDDDHKKGCFSATFNAASATSGDFCMKLSTAGNWTNTFDPIITKDVDCVAVNVTHVTPVCTAATTTTTTMAPAANVTTTTTAPAAEPTEAYSSGWQSAPAALVLVLPFLAGVQLL